MKLTIQADPTTRRDPVCGMNVVPDKAAASFSHEGTTYYFCSVGCRDKFARDPERFLHAPAKGAHGMDAVSHHAPSPASRGKWTCPMHPQIIRDGPGSCPICGMALEPLVATGEENPELREMSRRFWASTALTAPLVVLAMAHLIPGHPLAGLLPTRTLTFLELALATPVCVWGAWPFYERAVASVRNRSLNMFTLIGLGVFTAYAYSLIAALFPGIFPAGFRDSSGGVGVYFEAAAVIVTLVLLGQVLELRARGQT